MEKYSDWLGQIPAICVFQSGGTVNEWDFGRTSGAGVFSAGVVSRCKCLRSS